MQQPTRLLRSWMFVPGDKQKMLDKALGLHVDAIMMDIEDGVAPSEKDNARRGIAATLNSVAARLQTDPALRTPARYVRVNAVGSERMRDDLRAVVRPGLEGLVIPKVETPQQVATVENILAGSEAEAGLSAGSVRLLVAIESPVGLFNAYGIASSSRRIVGLLFGAEDFCREMGLPLRREAEASDLVYARSHLATAAAAAHVQAVDGVWTDLKDPEGMRRHALQARRLAMSGVSIIHPSQIDAANAAFTPTRDEIAYAVEVMQAFEAARARGDGAIALRGQLLDYPIVDRARQTLALGESLGVQASEV